MDEHERMTILCCVKESAAQRRAQTFTVVGGLGDRI